MINRSRTIIPRIDKYDDTSYKPSEVIEYTLSDIELAELRASEQRTSVKPKKNQKKRFYSWE